MKFIKKNIKIFIAFIIVIILTSSVSIYAATKYNSSEVLYEVANGNNITVETALNDLYKKNTSTLENLLNRIEALENNELSGSGTTDFNSIYPVGSVYISTSSTNPGTLFGGTWEAYGTGRTLVGIDSSQTVFNTVGKTGGAKYVTTSNHTHGLNAGYAMIDASVPEGWLAFNFKSGVPWWTHNWNASVSWTGGTKSKSSYAVSLGGTTDAGGSATISVLQPYIVTYMWRRTA